MLIRRLKKAAAIYRHPTAVKDIAVFLSCGRWADAARTVRAVARRPDLGAEKVVSRKYRYLYICIPKVASRSIIAALRGADPDAEIIYDRSVADICARRPEVRDYYSFAFIRHPFDRALSLYAEMRFFQERFAGEHRRLKASRQQHYTNTFPGLGEIDSFDDYCRWLNTPYGSDAFADRHFLSQHAQLGLADGGRPDFIGRLENIGEDWPAVAARLGMPSGLPMLNTMAGWQPADSQAVETARREMQAHLTGQNRKLLRIRYRADLDLYHSVARMG